MLEKKRSYMNRSVYSSISSSSLNDKKEEKLNSNNHAEVSSEDLKEQMSSQKLQTEIDESETLVMLVFCSEVSGVCQMMMPIFDDFKFEYRNKLKLKIVEGSDYLEICTRYVITQFPSFVFIHKGKVVAKTEGVISRIELTQKIEQLLNHH